MFSCSVPACEMNWSSVRPNFVCLSMRCIAAYRTPWTYSRFRIWPIAPPHHLSGGEKKKVALASVLVMQPEVVLLDEPTSGLDPRSQTNLINLLGKWDDGSKTIITATHDLHMLEDLASQCAILERGRLIAQGPTTQILDDRDLLERANLIHAHRSSRHPAMHSHQHLHSSDPHIH